MLLLFIIQLFENLFLNKMLVVFFVRVKPVSTRAKPVCIKNTKTAVINTQTVFNADNVDVSISVSIIYFYSLMYNDSGPISPVLIRMDSSMGEMNIFPSPKSPVRAAFIIALQAGSTNCSRQTKEMTIRSIILVS